MVAWAFKTGALPEWKAASLSAMFSEAPVSADRSYPLRLALPPAKPVGGMKNAQRSNSFALEPRGTTFTPGTELASPSVSEPTPGQPTMRISKPERLPEAFDIRDFGSAGVPEGKDVLLAAKPVVLRGERLGAVELAVGKGASVAIDRRALADLLGDRAPALSASLERETTDQVPLSALRSSEVAIRYDPIADAIVIETPQ